MQCKCQMKVNRGEAMNDELFKSCHCSSGCSFCATHNQLPGKTWTFRPDKMGDEEATAKVMALIGSHGESGTCADSIHKRLLVTGKTITIQKVTAIMQRLHDEKRTTIVPNCGFSGPEFHRIRKEESE